MPTHDSEQYVLTGMLGLEHLSIHMMPHKSPCKHVKILHSLPIRINTKTIIISHISLKMQSNSIAPYVCLVKPQSKIS
jgi:hypothetical protein